ncbi:hypothetical protein RWV98_18805 [Agathobaculum sp. NTUH-O15-33]|uniref:hypothetical protein n=1 Tax=Agathobaculum sp. NTUH-O15-33 TaxID=3079302 RepID=UPI0029587F88|nr:hypothetical protein [Agathobaculum sp. NTUH-O15-33]WNX84600.1 hypothetical protein RWV98_18805 [Agathobaculum sp. NTUH-O15-33]
MENDNIDLREHSVKTLEPVQINFRVDKRDADVFRAFCKEHGVSQAEGFRLLTAQIQHSAAHDAMQRETAAREALKQENAMLRRALLDARRIKKQQQSTLKRAGRLADKEKRVLAGIACCREFSAIVCQRFLKRAIDDEYEVSTWKQRKLKSFAFRFPKNAGTEILTLEFLCYENQKRGSAILGHFFTEDQQRVKLKIWPNRSYTPLCSTQAFYKNDLMSTGRRWLCTYERMSGGWLELVCAIPAPQCFEQPAEYGFEPTAEVEELAYDQEVARRQILRDMEIEVARNNIGYYADEYAREDAEEAERKKAELAETKSEAPQLTDVIPERFRQKKEKPKLDIQIAEAEDRRDRQNKF